MSRRQFLLAAGGLCATASLADYTYLSAESAERNNAKTFPSVEESKSLRDRAAAKGLIYGSCSSRRELSLDAEFAASFVHECGILVPGNELKGDALRPTFQVFDFANAEWLVDFAGLKNLLFRGHTLVWHDALPKWFQHIVNEHNAEQFLTQHISTVVGRYAGRVHFWDVVNETVLPMDRQSEALRNTPWLQLLGPKYIDVAFKAADAYVPTVRL